LENKYADTANAIGVKTQNTNVICSAQAAAMRAVLIAGSGND
jgi:hypothetical protein